MTQAQKKTVTVIPGDGVGPECVRAAQDVVEATGAPVEWEECQAGALVFRKGVPSGVPAETVESIRRTRVALKGPLETPVGFGEKSANVTLRKLFETYGNVRPVRELPRVPTPYAGRGIDLVVVRENVEDLYAGIEHLQTPSVAQCLKLMSRKGCEKVVRLAFALARAEGRKSVHCATKANIMKLTEGLLKRTFEEVAPEYPEIEAHHIIVDNCAHQLARRPEQFEVIVTSNMNGDILSDLTSGQVGGLGFAPSANLGHEVAIFEAVHGSAPKYAGRGVINPTALILSAVMMLRHLGEIERAAMIEDAVLYTLERGEALTGDVVGYDKGASTAAFTEAVIRNLGRHSDRWPARRHRRLVLPRSREAVEAARPRARAVVGVDVFVESAEPPVPFGLGLEQATRGTAFQLKMVSNRGTKVYPDVGAMADCVDHYRCRFLHRAGAVESDGEVLALLVAVGARYRWMHVEKLQTFDGAPGFTRAQGED